MGLWRGILKIIGLSGNIVDVNEDGQLHVVLEGKIDIGNSTSTPLLANDTFTGDAINTLAFAVIIVSVFSDVISAIDGLQIQQSVNGTDWDHYDRFTIPAGIGKTFTFQPQALYMRIVYTNGAVNQTNFRLQITLKKTYIKPSSHRIQDFIVTEDDAELVKAVLTGADQEGIFRNVLTTRDGNLLITDNSSGLAIAQNLVGGMSYIHKFGNAPDFDAADGIVTVWDGANDAGINQMRYVYSTSADIDSICSDSGADTQQIEIQGLDTNYEIVTQTITLTGQTRVAIPIPCIRVYRMRNIGSVNNAGRIFCYVNSAIVAGVPSDPTKVRAIIQPGNNQTLMALYTIPAGKTGYMRDWYASTAGSNKSSNYPIELRARPFGSVFQLKHIAAIADNGVSAYQHDYKEPEKFLEKTDIEMRASASAVGATAASISAGFDIVLIDN